MRAGPLVAMMETAVVMPVSAARNSDAGTGSENAPRVRAADTGMMSSAVGRAVISPLGYARPQPYTIHPWI